MIVSNVKSNGHSIGHLGAKEAYWHTDMCFIETPPSASLLRSLEIPSEGGDTSYMNMEAAYAALQRQVAAKGQSAVLQLCYRLRIKVIKGQAIGPVEIFHLQVSNFDPGQSLPGRKPKITERISRQCQNFIATQLVVNG